MIAVRREYESNHKQGAHWHSNASELVYCISGSGHVQIGLPSARGPAGRVDGGCEMIGIGPDESAFIPLGYPHDIIAGPEGIEVMIIFDAGNANTFEQKYIFPPACDSE
ncbi:MAG: cupin domain-containing protein [Ardenticatenaceae bacterium]